MFRIFILFYMLLIVNNIDNKGCFKMVIRRMWLLFFSGVFGRINIIKFLETFPEVIHFPEANLISYF
jgi:hypothetical protein